MTDYSKLSDFEINSAVHNALMKEPYKIEFLGNDRIRWVRGSTNVTTEKVEYSKKSLKDYCNNPADAWQIISDSRISIYFDKTIPEHDGEFKQWCCAISPCQNYQAQYQSNPLRAAMIVFLMMQEKKE